ncbi:MAG: hypothetical protein ACLQJ7_11670 [Syntrophobacteraceae bacterium]
MVNFKKVPQIEPYECELSIGERIFIHLYRPEDAPGICRLFQTVYGGNYPVKRFYKPEELAEALDTGENYSVVARKESGDITGHMALFRSAPYPGLYECGAGLVLPEYRQEGINQWMLYYVYELLAPGLGIAGTWGEAVCNHVYMQKTVRRYNHIETGLEIDLMPSETYAKEKSSSGRVTSLIAFRSYVPRPHTVYLPPVYEKALRSIYSELDDRRTMEVCGDTPPAGTCSRASWEVFEFPGVIRIAVTAVGEDFESYFNGLEDEILTGKIKVVQVSVNLGCPWAGRAVKVLRGRGYFIGGILPRWFDEDALLMQKIVGRPDWEGIHLFSDRAGEILGIVRKDWEEVARI